MVGSPASIGRYRIDGVIGAGGFATVYRAHDERLDATVAVKVLAENHCLDPDVRERFLQEGRVLRHIGGSHVVTVHDLGETERGQPYLVLDHADRGDLAARVDAHRADGWSATSDDVLAIAEPLAAALSAVHASRIVHRDLAPRNLLLRSTRMPPTTPATARSVLLGPDEQLVLADLGLSKDLATASGLTVAGGTAGFTPPEQRDGPGTVDERADLWAASAVLLWLVLGHPPDDAGAWSGELARLGWPQAFAGALATGLDRDPAGRPSSPEAWLASVEAGLAPPQPAAAPTDPFDRPDPGDDGARPGLPAGVAGTARRRLAVAVVAALVVGTALGVVGTRALDGDRSAPATTEVVLEDGTVRVESSDGPRRVAIVGPGEVTSGETATFLADTAGVDSTVWVGPDGGVHPDVGVLDVETSSTGRATVRLIGVDGQGRTVEVEHGFRVVP